MQRVAARFDFPWPFDRQFKKADNDVGKTESRQLLTAGRVHYERPGEVIEGLVIPYMSPETAKGLFLAAALGLS